MRNFEQLDTGCFRSFCLAIETLNFTEAARKGSLTQSGVSQHVARLEEQLSAQLFLRIGKKLVLTEAGVLLREYVERYFDEQHVLKEKVSHKKQNLEGLVRYAMPESCLMSPHFSLLLQARNKLFPGVNLRITLCPSEDVIERALSAEIDFGFVTRKTMNPALDFSFFCNEEYVMVTISGRKKPDVARLDDVIKLPFIAYPGFDVIFDKWLEVKFPKAKNLSWEHLNIVGEVNNLFGVVDMIAGDLGCTIIPRHCIESHPKKSKIAEVEGPVSRASINDIFIVTLQDRVIPRRVSTVIDTFNKMKKAS
jgi:DNA-binding transcriptional LysR family regulator